VLCVHVLDVVHCHVSRLHDAVFREGLIGRCHIEEEGLIGRCHIEEEGLIVSYNIEEEGLIHIIHNIVCAYLYPLWFSLVYVLGICVYVCVCMCVCMCVCVCMW
jgi:hypothetical protein